MKKNVRLILIIILIIIIISTIIGFVIGNYFYNLALNPNTDKSMVIYAPHNLGDNTDLDKNSEYIDRQLLLKQWLENEGVEHKYITSNDDLKLHAYMLENNIESNKWVILFHGYGGQSSQMFSTAKIFYENGYNILIPDARGQGMSEGNYIGMGWHDRLDGVEWINKILEWDEKAKIAMYGVSMGGATVMYISGEDLPDNVVAIVEDCGYSSVWDEFSYQLKELFNMPEFPVMHFASIVTKIRAGYFLNEADTVKQVAKSRTPMMFIHGDQDTFVPSNMVYKVFDAANVEKELLIVEGAGHGESASILEENYWIKVFDFIEKYM